MENIDLREMTRTYLSVNDLSVSFMARKTGISVTTLQTWLYGERKLKPYAIKSVKEFLSGNYLISMDKIIEEMKRGSNKDGNN